MQTRSAAKKAAEASTQLATVQPTAPVKAAAGRKNTQSQAKKMAIAKKPKPIATKMKRTKAAPPQSMKGDWVLPHGMGMKLGPAVATATDAADEGDEPSGTTGDGTEGTKDSGDEEDSPVASGNDEGGITVPVKEPTTAAESGLSIPDASISESAIDKDRPSEDNITESTVPTQAIQIDVLLATGDRVIPTHEDIPAVKEEGAPFETRRRITRSFAAQVRADEKPEAVKSLVKGEPSVKEEQDSDGASQTPSPVLPLRKLVVIKGVGLNNGVFRKTGRKITASTRPLDPDFRIMVKRGDNPYGLTPGYTPYIYRSVPTPEACEEVYNRLAEMHGECKAPEKMPAASLEVAGCGEVPCVLDALLRTLISGNTLMARADEAIKSLAKRYGLRTVGSGKGSINWDKVRLSSHEELAQVIRVAGDGPKRGRFIKKILDTVYRENIMAHFTPATTVAGGLETSADTHNTEVDIGENIAAVMQGRESTEDNSGFFAEVNAVVSTIIDQVVALVSSPASDQPDLLSLDYMHKMTKDEAMSKFVSFPGIGIKTAACVTLFCLQIPCFAVDTHVHRFCGWLGWTPIKADPDNCFRHGDFMVPDHLKYGLHQLFIRHGQLCHKCRKVTRPGTQEWNEAPPCPLEDLLTRTKDEIVPVKLKAKRGRKEDEPDADEEALDDEGDDDAKPRPAKKSRRAQPRKRAVRAKTQNDGGEQEDQEVREESEEEYTETPKAKRTRKPRARKAKALVEEVPDTDMKNAETAEEDQPAIKAGADARNGEQKAGEDNSESELSKHSELPDFEMVDDSPDGGSEYEE
ncbi:hypothetical protein OQA88_7281 [Cercophora sp. LCS_1]